jgi:hypothetical protein
VYQSDELGAVDTIALEDERLVWRRLRSDDTPLLPNVQDGFHTKDGVRLVFQRDVQGVITGFSFSTVRTRGIVFGKVSTPSRAFDHHWNRKPE